MKNLWFTLYPEVFIWIKKENCIIYNSKNYKSLNILLKEEVKSLCEEIVASNNLYSVEITQKDYQKPIVGEWISSVIKINAGYLSYAKKCKKPISLYPLLRVQDDIIYYRFEHNNGIGGSIIKNVNEVTIYFNGSDYGSKTFYNQSIYPIQDKNIILDFDKILLFLKSCKNPFLQTINLVGNIFSIQYYKLEIEKLKELCIHINLHVCVEDFVKNRDQIKDIDWGNKISFILVFIPSKFSLLTSIIDYDYKIKIIKALHIFSETDYSNAMEYINIDLKKNRYNIIPILNEENIDFFKSYIFTDLKELRNVKLSKRHILIRQALNAHDFGKLTIMPDGKVYANVNEEALGTIDNYPYDIVYKEFTSGKSWFNIRNQKPCSDCVYQWLCPSPSNYERAIGKPNLCHIKV